MIDASDVPLPSKLQFEPVGRCNLRCPMCAAPYREVAQSDALVEVDLFRRVLQELPALEELHLQGIGEPLLHPRFFELVRLAVDRGARVTTSSNLTFLSEEMGDLCVSSGLDTVHVSIDAANPEVYRRIRVGASLAQVLANVERLLQARRRRGSRLPRLKLVAVLMHLNLGELPGLIDLAHDKGFDGVFVQRLSHRFREPGLPSRFRPLRAFAARQSLDDHDPAALEEILAGARQKAAGLGLEIRLPRARPITSQPEMPRQTPCDWPWTQAYVCFDGSVLPCCMVSTPDRYCIGSVVDGGLASVWRGARLQQFRQQLKSDTPPALCQSCAIYLGVF